MKITLTDNRNWIISVSKNYSNWDWETTDNLNKIYRVDWFYIYMNANSMPLNVFKDKTEMLSFFQEKGEVFIN